MTLIPMNKTLYSQEVISAMAENRIAYLTQPVKAIKDQGEELYRECLARMVDRDGSLHAPMTFIPELEACGDIHLLDRHMVKLALENLARSDELVLGCNVSADTMQEDVYWNAICSLIRAQPQLASRLVIEVTETWPVVNLERLAHNIAEARALGCRIAIDDFGDGYLSPTILLQLEVDIVKIDASMLRTIRPGAGQSSTFHHIVGFAKCIAPIVVVEGIEDADDLGLSQNAGATHVQGYFIGRPMPGSLQPRQTRVSTALRTVHGE